MLDQLQISQLIHQQRLVRSMEERCSKHPLEALGDVVIVHQETSEEEAD